MKIYGSRPLVLPEMSDSEQAGAEFEADVYELIKNMPEDAGRTVLQGKR